MTARAQLPRAHDAAQDTLPLSFPVDQVAARPRLELATPCSRPFDSDAWLFSVAWEGSRCLLEVRPDRTARLRGAGGDLSARFPELTGARPLLGAHEAVLEVSVCVLDAEGRPDLGALAGRVISGASRPLAVALATDLLCCDGTTLTARPLEDRLARLRDVVPRDSRIQVPDHVAGHGRAFAAAAAARGLAGIVARHRSSLYRAGVASPDRLAIPLRPRRDSVVMGWFSSADQVGVIVGEWLDGRLSVSGSAAVEDAAAVRWLSGVVGPARGAPPGEADGAPGVTWVRPHLVATVEPSPNAALLVGLPALALVALRDDVDAAWCVRRPPVEPPQATVDAPLRPFSPTVLSALPLGA